MASSPTHEFATIVAETKDTEAFLLHRAETLTQKNKDRDCSRSSGTQMVQVVSRYFGGAELGDLGAVELGALVAGVRVAVPRPLLPAGREVEPLALGGAGTPDCTL